ncbi:uncharacterized protein [Physcomitrium patens]|uniref:Uncharacterized protein n=1 Tax=Physcomitrium patens TaxID=3218 RepID=A0A2K1L8U1_PHYPA|nr:protein high chlorophyll fluorescent 107-like [Physcomitrium patens]XP_024375269.1 protein high chlorophyll fluorescent 107-like [Physcomitrium patens]PNR62458.1 hypothetical protein PHYPA_000882 [Physcomitrium patens]|eukprot:XP_024375259.1 protein high chlorophyll fluorescent 107-like [Physcomitrella patens]
MTLAAGGFLHPSLLPVALCSRNSSLHRNSASQHALHSHSLTSIQLSPSPPELLRLHSNSAGAFLAKGAWDYIDSGTEVESGVGNVVSGDKAAGNVKLLASDTQRVLVTDGGTNEERQVSDALDSVTFQSWRKDNSEFTNESRAEQESGIVASNEQNSRNRVWRAPAEDSSDSSGKQPERQYRPRDQSYILPVKKVDRWVNPSVRKFDGKEADQNGDVYERNGEGAGSSATGNGGRFSSSNLSLVSKPGARYQRLPINLDLQLYWARLLRQKGQQNQAMEILKQCIRDWPDDGRPYVALGTLLKKLGKVQEARKVFEDGCQAVRGENAYIWQAWAVLEDRVGNTGKARKLFDAATAADRTHPAAWHGWAVLELREGNTKKARALLKKGLKFHGPNEYLLQTLALLDVKMGRYDQARILFGKATRSNPKSAASWLAWALMEASQERKTTARNLFKNGIEASPKNRYVWQAWALFEAKEGNKERARQLFQRGQQLNPLDPVIYQSYGLFEYDCGHIAIAKQLFKRGVSVGPQHQPAWIAWAWVEWKEGNLDAARELFQRAIAVDPRSMDAVRAFQAWGILEDREGNVGVARVLFKRALRVDSQNVPTWMSWAAMEERQGNAVRADELRSLCLQQRTEVVDENPWDVNLENMLAPAIDKLRDFLKLEQRFPWSKKERMKPMDERTVGSLEALEDANKLEEEFDVDAFLGGRFSERSGNAAGLTRQESKVAAKRQQKLSDNVIT